MKEAIFVNKWGECLQVRIDAVSIIVKTIIVGSNVYTFSCFKSRSFRNLYADCEQLLLGYYYGKSDPLAQ